MSITDDKKLDGKVALVTGASRGIGAAVSLELARQGAHIIAVARTVGGLEELDDRIRTVGGEATLVPLDLKDFDGIDRLGGHVAEKYGRLDILIGNAAILGPLSPLPHIRPKEWEDLMTVNVTANWRLLRSFDPLLRNAEAGRAIFVTSTVARNPRAYWGGYATTKAALECLVKTYAAETSKTNLRTNLINPGPTRTAMRARAMPGEDPQTLPHPAELTPLFLKLCLPDCTANGEVFDFRDWKDRL
tara:strand:- start:1639 stop:2376 length:738 start_codon:yes stop_codon:yes gene_type:complete